MTNSVTLEQAISDAEAQIDPARLAALCAAMVDIASPTGEEATLAGFLRDEAERVGLEASTQVIDEHMSNAYARLVGQHGQGSGHGGRSLLLYAPIDTVTDGDAGADLPWVGDTLRPDMLPSADVRDGVVIGLGAQNPKGHGACVLAAAEAIVAAGIQLDGDLYIGFGAGGMPSNRRRPDLSDGHGVGCAALVNAIRPDEAVISKTGWAVSWEEVGLAWFEVDVAGSHTYVGSRHLLPYRNAIADAGHIIGGLELWFERWAEEHRDGLVAPQGVVSAIEGGWPHKPAFTTSLCRFSVDLRTSPRTPIADVEQAFVAEVDRLAAQIGADATCRRTVFVPGTTTDPDSDIITSSIACWEALTGAEHQPISGLSGATDANILRSHGVPTARVGLPKVSAAHLGEVDFQLGMNAVGVDDMVRLTRLLLRIAIDRCGVATP